MLTDSPTLTAHPNSSSAPLSPVACSPLPPLTPREAILFNAFITRGCSIRALTEHFRPPRTGNTIADPPAEPPLGTPLDILSAFASAALSAVIDAYRRLCLSADTIRHDHLRARALEALDETARKSAHYTQRRLAAAAILKALPTSDRADRASDRVLSPSSPVGPGRSVRASRTEGATTSPSSPPTLPSPTVDSPCSVESPSLQPEGLAVRSRGWSESTSDTPGMPAVGPSTPEGCKKYPSGSNSPDAQAAHAPTNIHATSCSPAPAGPSIVARGAHAEGVPPLESSQDPCAPAGHATPEAPVYPGARAASPALQPPDRPDSDFPDLHSQLAELESRIATLATDTPAQPESPRASPDTG